MRAVTVLRSGCNKFRSVLRSLHRSTEFAGGDCERLGPMRYAVE
jgi:hypothetical protein